jgi:hypothetical protein
MPHPAIPSWCWQAAVVLLTWGIVGLLQKLSTNYPSAELAQSVNKDLMSFDVEASFLSSFRKWRQQCYLRRKR